MSSVCNTQDLDEQTRPEFVGTPNLNPYTEETEMTRTSGFVWEHVFKLFYVVAAAICIAYGLGMLSYQVMQHTLQHTATHCNILQHTATRCNTLQRTATHCKALQRTATHCNTLQHTTTHCNTLQWAATYYFFEPVAFTCSAVR